MKNHATATYTPLRIPLEHGTSDHSKNLITYLYKHHNYRFQLEIVIGEIMDCYRNFIYLFHLEK